MQNCSRQNSLHVISQAAPQAAGAATPRRTISYPAEVADRCLSQHLPVLISDPQHSLTVVQAAPQQQGGYASASFPADDAGWGAADTRGGGGGGGDGWGYDDDSGAPGGARGSGPYQARRA